MKYSELYRILQQNGWVLKKGKRKGGHDKLVHPDHGYSILVGRHQSQEVPTGTYLKIMKDAGLKP